MTRFAFAFVCFSCFYFGCLCSGTSISEYEIREVVEQTYLFEIKQQDGTIKQFTIKIKRDSDRPIRARFDVQFLKYTYAFDCGFHFLKIKGSFTQDSKTLANVEVTGTYTNKLKSQKFSKSGKFSVA